MGERTETEGGFALIVNDRNEREWGSKETKNDSERKERRKEVDINYLEECEGPPNVSILLFWYLTYVFVFNVDCLSRLVLLRLRCVLFVCRLLSPFDVRTAGLLSCGLIRLVKSCAAACFQGFGVSPTVFFFFWSS